MDGLSYSGKSMDGAEQLWATDMLKVLTQ